MFDNQIQLQYKLQPELKFYTKFPNFTTSLTVSDPTVSINTAIYSPTAKSLYVTVVYNETIQRKKLGMSYRPPASPYSHALISTDYEWPVMVGNGLSLTYYPDQVYKNAKMFDYLTLCIYVGCLFVFFLSLFFRKMIGVQLIILVQTQVLSIALLKEVHPYFGPLTTDKYAFGYNGLEDILGLKQTTRPIDVGLYSIIGFSPLYG